MLTFHLTYVTMTSTQTHAARGRHTTSWQQRIPTRALEITDICLAAVLVNSAKFISWLAFILLRFVFRYRRAVIMSNLRTSFPLKSSGEIRQLAIRYYRHLGDLVVEPFLFFFAPATLRNKLIAYSNLELLERHYVNRKPVVAFASHYGNWEYMINLPEVTRYGVYTAYSVIKNGAINRLMVRLRSHFGVQLIPRAAFYRRGLSALREQKSPALLVVIADQRPAPGSAKFRLSFLGQVTAVQTGGERMAAAANAGIIYITCRKLGQFRYEYTLNGMPAAKAGEALSVTKSYYKLLENSIDIDPAYWLWSHNRWKAMAKREER